MHNVRIHSDVIGNSPAGYLPDNELVSLAVERPDLEGVILDRRMSRGDFSRLLQVRAGDHVDP